jgi:UDP-N-acetylglucosamine acyltransferase
LAGIHPLAYVDPGAELGVDVTVGPFCYVEDGVRIGDRTRLDTHVLLKKGAIIGADNYLGKGVVLGSDPQDRAFGTEPTFVHLGDRNILREYVTIHRAVGEGKATTVGNDCFLMAYCHLGHNVTLQDKVTMANSVGISGHVTIEEMVTIGGMVGVHQWCRVGKVAMVGGMSRIVRDVPPFMLVEGHDQEVRDINAVGLRRIGVTAADRLALHKACKLLFRSQLGLTNALETVRREVELVPAVEYLMAFEERRFGGKNGRGDQP